MTAGLACDRDEEASAENYRCHDDDDDKRDTSRETRHCVLHGGSRLGLTKMIQQVVTEIIVEFADLSV